MRLLVVEDEPRIASFIRRGLEEQHHAVDLASDGDEAMLLATTNDYGGRVVVEQKMCLSSGRP